MTIAQIDEPFRLLSEPVADGDGFFRREVQRPGLHELPAEWLVAHGQRAAAHHDVEEHAGGEAKGDYRATFARRSTATAPPLSTSSMRAGSSRTLMSSSGLPCTTTRSASRPFSSVPTSRS